MTRVSIVIPCYNAAEYLDETVSSALGQTHGDLEVIVVDDGSTDPATIQLLHANPWREVRILHQENRGLAGARNAGIAASSGAYILPLDADDIIEPTYVARAAEVLDTHQDVGIVYCRAWRFGAEDCEWALPSFDLPRMLVQNLIFASAMFRRSAWAGLGGYREDMVVREDHHFWLGILANGAQAHRIEDILFRYRILSTSMNARASRDDLIRAHAVMVRDYRDLYAEHADFVVRHGFDLVDEVTDWRYRYGPLQRVIDRHPRPYAVLRRLRALVPRQRTR